MNCDVVASSRYAELFGGLPLSSFAAAWFLAILLVIALRSLRGMAARRLARADLDDRLWRVDVGRLPLHHGCRSEDVLPRVPRGRRNQSCFVHPGAFT